MLYNQPLAIRFGNELLHHIDPVWDQLDIAVAWVRASGMVYLADRFANFLRHGGVLSVIVGIDLENTTSEGLQALLDLEQHGDCQTYVYHNEADSVFHPKLYLWRNEEEARLIVGSNNITQSGLYINVEAGLQVDVTVDDPVVAQTLDALSSWKSDEGGLAKRLDAALLAQLIAGGYVPSEAAARASIRQRRSDTITEDPNERSKVAFRQYDGVAPRNFLRLFRPIDDRKRDGRLYRKPRQFAAPIFRVPLDNPELYESKVIADLSDKEQNSNGELGGGGI